MALEVIADARIAGYWFMQWPAPIACSSRVSIAV